MVLSQFAESLPQHRYNRYFFLTDLQSAYQNVDGKKLAEVLCGLDPRLSAEREEVYGFLTQFCLDPKGGLVVGAPASPDLFNIYAGKLLDEPLAALCEQYGLTYSRYLDDLAFSSRTESIGEKKRKKLRAVIRTAGFSISDHKTHVMDLAKGPIIITGVGVELGGRIFLPRHYLRMIRGLIHRAMHVGDVCEHRIHGMMGVFRSSSHKHNLNRTEIKLLFAYRLYQRFLRGR
ncbi:MAG: Retron-type reverse transcriptase [Parcubacteria group bacterium Gr01-1014_106]|nr:MAG: Retron-type reverse transcriptase [Parcubacteria group bacterium Gr01-1014_106]